jgi:NTE family protein
MRKIAIACQGGGSHAAFTAGVLHALLGIEQPDFEIVALSGTSGGAVCASLVWSGLVSGKADARLEAQRRLVGFWRDLEASWPADWCINACAVAFARLPVGLEISPYFCWPLAEWRMEQLLQRYLELERLTGFPDLPNKPKLLVGATDVLNGEGGPLPGESLTYKDVIASAAIPPIFRAVRTRGSVYWDGLFNRNPPIREFTDIEADDRPEEIWVIRLNPKERREEPMSMPEIIDRRNELAGNLAIDQELYHISRINDLIGEGALNKPGYKLITLRQVQQDIFELDYPSKLDRDPRLLRQLFDGGTRVAGRLFKDDSILRTKHLRPAAKEQKKRPSESSRAEVLAA